MIGIFFVRNLVIVNVATKIILKNLVLPDGVFSVFGGYNAGNTTKQVSKTLQHETRMNNLQIWGGSWSTNLLINLVEEDENSRNVLAFLSLIFVFWLILPKKNL